MSHFNQTVPTNTQNRLKAFADYALDDFISDFKESENCGNVDTISGIDKSGWIPLQKGGYIISEFYRNDTDSSYHFTKSQTVYNNELQKNCEIEYCQAHNLDYVDYDDCDFQEYESTIFDSALLRLNIYVDNSDMVKIEFSVNYKDAPYYRLALDTSLKELSYTIEEFMNTDFETICELLKNYR